MSMLSLCRAYVTANAAEKRLMFDEHVGNG